MDEFLYWLVYDNPLAPSTAAACREGRLYRAFAPVVAVGLLIQSTGTNACTYHHSLCHTSVSELNIIDILLSFGQTAGAWVTKQFG